MGVTPAQQVRVAHPQMQSKIHPESEKQNPRGDGDHVQVADCDRSEAPGPDQAREQGRDDCDDERA